MSWEVFDAKHFCNIFLQSAPQMNFLFLTSKTKIFFSDSLLVLCKMHNELLKTLYISGSQHGIFGRKYLFGSCWKLSVTVSPNCAFFYACVLNERFFWKTKSLLFERYSVSAPESEFEVEYFRKCLRLAENLLDSAINDLSLLKQKKRKFLSSLVACFIQNVL